MRIFNRLLATIALASTVLAATCSVYAFAFFAWVTATPVNNAVQTQAGLFANVWLGAVVAFFLTASGLTVYLIRQCLRT
jgi:hypothetical protein